MAKIYCEYCGAQLLDGAKFCTNCGAPAPKTDETGHDRQTVVEGEGTYSIVLGSLENCTKAAAGDLLEGLLGYSDEEAEQLLNVLPALAAQNLTYEQAQYVAQAMTEYGMQVSIRSGEQYVEADEQSASGSSLFDEAGELLAKAAAVFATLSAINRMRDFRRYDRIDYRDHMYVWRRPVPPKKPSLISRLLGILGVRKRRPSGVFLSQHRPRQSGFWQRRPQQSGMAPRRPLQTGFAPRRPLQSGMTTHRPGQTGFTPGQKPAQREKRRRLTGVRRAGDPGERH